LPDHNTVIRAGYGIYTNQAAYNIIQNAILNLPFFFSKSVTNPTAAIPALSTEMILTAPATGAITGNNLNHDFKIEYNNVWNLAIEHRFSSGVHLLNVGVALKTIIRNRSATVRLAYCLTSEENVDKPLDLARIQLSVR
jgi:hypothetical protein